MEFDNVLYRIEEGIAFIKLNRPDVRNALSPAMWADLRAAFRAAGADPQSRAVILSGEGGKAFASGADIRALRERGTLEVMRLEFQEILREIELFPKPVICAVDGYALGAGCEVAMSCDIRIATRKSKFGQPETGLGIIPGAGGTQRLTRIVGPAIAKELIFTGEIIDAEEAKRIGLINKIAADADEMMRMARETAEKILQKGPVAIWAAKLAICGGADTDITTGMLIEKLANTVAFGTQDRIEGTSAFLEKRKPQYNGR